MSAAREAKARRGRRRTIAGGRLVDVCVQRSYKEAEA
jgi:hypothetical protein